MGPAGGRSGGPRGGRHDRRRAGPARPGVRAAARVVASGGTDDPVPATRATPSRPAPSRPAPARAASARPAPGRAAGRPPLGPLLAELRAARGWSQQRVAAELCAAAGVPTLTRHEVSRWERQRRLPGDFWSGWLAVVLGVPGDLLADAAARSRRPAPGGPGRPRPPDTPGAARARRPRSTRAARRGGDRARPAATG
ncbi:helix-turn-helix transcriptional regulator [Micromonospora chersina]|uniref:helix-turn-helix transcriptional regulator n=1 Tax=Micromonospora chersina TaxID=47854 RepID=UPI0033FE7498